jgi:hypothetical protein
LVDRGRGCARAGPIPPAPPPPRPPAPPPRDITCIIHNIAQEVCFKLTWPPPHAAAAACPALCPVTSTLARC